MAAQRLISNVFGVVVVVVLGLLSTTTVSAAKSHTYSIAWAVPPNLNLGDLKQNVTVAKGDTLVFAYNKTTHSLMRVSKKHMESCDTNNPMNHWTDGNTKVLLNETVPYYFICGTPRHCKKGQFLSVLVNETAEAPPAPGPSSPPESSPSPDSEGPSPPGSPGSSQASGNSTASPPSHSDANGLRSYVTTWVVVVGAGLLALSSF